MSDTLRTERSRGRNIEASRQSYAYNPSSLHILFISSCVSLTPSTTLAHDLIGDRPHHVTHDTRLSFLSGD